ncbi:MAG: MFS transporter [Patescibacteria group bacterium]
MKSTIRIYIGSVILRSLSGSMVGAIYVKYLLMNGLSLFETSLLNCVFYIALIFLDVPTGAFADVFGRKKSVALSFACAALGQIAYGVSTTISGFITSEVILAFSVTFFNGALKAWAVDQLKYHGHDGNFTELFGKVNIFGWCVCIPGAVTGGYFLSLDSRLPWFVCSAISCIGLLFCLIYMKEDYFRRKKVSLRRSYKMMCLTIRISIRYVKKSRVVRFIILSSIFQVFAVQAPNMQWVPRFEETIGGTAMLGIAMASFALMNALGSFLAKRVLKATRDEERMIMWCQVMIGAFIIGSALVPGPLGFVLFLLHQIPRGMFFPVKDAYFQDHISSRERATMSSFESIVPNMGGVVALFSTGFMAESHGIPMTWTVSGSILVTAAVALAFASRKALKKA